jgi:hypothetical protein
MCCSSSFTAPDLWSCHPCNSDSRPLESSGRAKLQSVAGERHVDRLVDHELQLVPRGSFGPRATTWVPVTAASPGGSVRSLALPTLVPTVTSLFAEPAKPSRSRGARRAREARNPRTAGTARTSCPAEPLSTREIGTAPRTAWSPSRRTRDLPPASLARCTDFATVAAMAWQESPLAQRRASAMSS